MLCTRLVYQVFANVCIAAQIDWACHPKLLCIQTCTAGESGKCWCFSWEGRGLSLKQCLALLFFLCYAGLDWWYVDTCNMQCLVSICRCFLKSCCEILYDSLCICSVHPMKVWCCKWIKWMTCSLILLLCQWSNQCYGSITTWEAAAAEHESESLESFSLRFFLCNYD